MYRVLGKFMTTYLVADFFSIYLTAYSMGAFTVYPGLFLGSIPTLSLW